MTDNRRAIVVLTTSWGSRFGGLNSFSTDLCSALARVLHTHRVVCVALSANEDDKKQAEASGFVLHSLDVDPEGDALPSWSKQVLGLISPVTPGMVDWWIGHDTITGPLALACAGEQSAGRTAVVMHMSYADYGYVKHDVSAAADVADRTAEQRAVMERCDVAFAVGPLLLDRLKELRPANARSEMLVPGLYPKVAPPQTQRLQAITLGRFAASEALVKQAPLAVAAFARAVKSGFDANVRPAQEARLTVIGAPPDVAGHLRSLAEAEAGRVVNVAVLDFVDRPKLRELFNNTNLCMMLSWHEGFGLAAWEAIGAGIPVILSRFSGVYRLLDSIGGAATGCVRHLEIRGRGDGTPKDEDVETVRKQILKIASDLPRAMANAESLRRLLRFQQVYTWETAAATVAQALSLPVVETSLQDTSRLTAESLAEPRDVVEGVDVAYTHRALDLAGTYYHNGQYADALSTLEPLKKEMARSRVPVSTAIEATILECEILLRINEYARARTLVSRAASEASDHQDWARYIRARSVENVMLRDQGKYEQAATLAKELLHLAQSHCPKEVENAHRKLARSLALAGRWDDAVTHANEAVTLAQRQRDHEGEAKAQLALGEAFRHGLQQAEAAHAYMRSRDLAGRAGNVDCYLWAILGLSDSLFLLGEMDEADGMLKRIGEFVARPPQRFPLESVHIGMSRFAISHRRGERSDEEARSILEEYAKFDISWPRDYLQNLDRGDYSHPKRF